MIIKAQVEIEFDENKLMEKRLGMVGKAIMRVPLTEGSIRNFIKNKIVKELKSNLERELGGKVSVIIID